MVVQGHQLTLHPDLIRGGFLSEDDVPHRWFGSTCVGCEKGAVWRQGQLVFPLSSSVDRPHVDMPPDARELYEEARNTYPVSRRAAAALARASLESLLRELTPEQPRASLDELIASLSGLVNRRMWEVLTALRVLGNSTLHSQESDIKTIYMSEEATELVDVIFGAINELVDELVTRPAQSKNLYDMLPPGVRESAERKAAESGHNL